MKKQAGFFICLIGVLVTSFLLSGCSGFLIKSRDNDYLQTKTAPVLQGPGIGEDYPVQGSLPAAGAKPASKIPPGSLLSLQRK